MKILILLLVALAAFLLGRFVERRIFYKKTGIRLKDVKDYSKAKKEIILRDAESKFGLPPYPFWYMRSAQGVEKIHIEPRYDDINKEAFVVENFCNEYITFKIGDKKTVLVHEEVQRMITLLIAMIAPFRYYEINIDNGMNKVVNNALRDKEKLTNN